MNVGERSVKALSWAPGVITVLLLGLCGYWREYLKFKWAMRRLKYEVRLFLNSISALLRLVEGSQALVMGLQLSVPMPPVQRLEASKRHPRKCTLGVMAARQCIKRELVNILRMVEYSLYVMHARGFSAGFSSSCSLFRSHKWVNEGGRGGGADALLLEKLKCLRDDVNDCLSAVSVLLLKNHQSMGIARESLVIVLELTTACEYSRQQIEEVIVRWSAPCSPSVGPVVKELDTARLQCETILLRLYEAQMEVRQDSISHGAAMQVASRAAWAVRDSCQQLTETIQKWNFIHAPVVQKVVHKEGGEPLLTPSLSKSHATHETAKESCTEMTWDSNYTSIGVKDDNFASGYNLELAPPQDQAGNGPETKLDCFSEEVFESSSHARPEGEMLIPLLPQQTFPKVNSRVGSSLASVMEELHDTLSCRGLQQPCMVTTTGDHRDGCIGQDGMTSFGGKQQPSISFLNELQATITAKH